MENAFFPRLVWDTSQLFRKSLTSLRALTLLLVMCLSIGNVWGAKDSVELCTSWGKTLGYTTEYTQEYTIGNLSESTTKMTLGVQGVYRQSNANTYFQMNKKSGYFKNTTKLPGKITKIVTTWNNAKGATKCYFALNAAATTTDSLVTATAATTMTFTPKSGANYYYFNIDPSTGSGSAQMTSCKVYYETAVSGPDAPTFSPESGTEFSESSLSVSISADEDIYYTLNTSYTSGEDVFLEGTKYTEALNLTATTTIQAVAVDDNDQISEIANATYTKVTPKVLTSVTVSGDASKKTYVAGDSFDPTGLVVTAHYESDPDETITEGITWTYNPSQILTKDQISIGVKATVSEITSADWHNVTDLTVTAAVVYEKFTGDLVEDDYLICVSTDAMNNTVSSSRFGYTGVTVSSDKVTNPGATIVWHIAPSTTDGYWTIYSANASKYAASTGAANKAQLLESGTDDMSLWSVEKSGTSYHFTNKKNAANSVNAKLQKNGTYGFACYSSFSDIVLYKKSNGKETVKTPTFSPAAGLKTEAIDVTISCATDGATIYYTLDGSTPTSSSTPYTATIHLDAATIVKAIAIKDGMNDSGVATAEYTFDLPYTSLADFIEAAPTTEKALTLDAAQGVVIIGYVAKNIYVQDAAGTTMLLYNSTAVPEWSVGKRIEGTLTGTYDVPTTSGLNRMTLINTEGANANNDGVMPEPVVLTELTESEFASHKGQFIKMADQHFQATSLSSRAVDTKNTGETITTKLYDTFNYMASKTLPAKDDAAEIKGVFIKYNTTYELAPTSIAAGEATINVAPEGGSDSEHAVALAKDAQVVVTPVADFTTSLNGETITEATYVTIDEAKSIVVAATRDFYTDKSVTYYYKVDASAKAVTVNQPAEGGTIAADKASASAGATITLSHSAAPHYTFGSFTVVDASSNPVTVNENEGVYTFEMPNSDVTVTGTFIENAKATATFAKGEPSAAGDAPADIEQYVGENITLPANTFSFAGHKFAGWNDGANVYAAGASYEMPEGGKAFTATWEALSVWATTYTSNVTGIGTSNKVKISGTDYNANKQNKGASTSVTVPAGATALHFHALAWTGEAQTITVSGTCFTEALPFDIVADNGVSGSGSTYTLQTDPSQVGYFSIPLSDIEADTEVTFQAASNKRFVLFGVNAVQPASMTIEPTVWDFGNVKENASADKVFAVTPNAFVEGALSATFEGADAAKFSAVVDGNKVTVTFTPAAQGAMAATLKVSASNANVTASLSGTGIPATTPEIVVPADPVNFGKIKQEASVSDQQVSVTLNNLDAATAAISSSVFSIDKTTLVAGENTITISANTSVSAGEYSETITITGTGAEEKQITVNMEILSKWADTYTSNVEVGTDVVKFKDDPDGNEYEAIKKGTGTASQSATITVPKGTQTLHFHAAAWNNEATVLVVKQGDTELGSFNLYKDAGVKSSSPFTLEGNNYSTEQYFHVSVSAYTETDEADITFTTTASPYRFLLYGVNQEGGIVPVLDHLVIEGTATKTEYEVGDDFDPTGMTVNAIYTLEDVEQPIDVTDDVEWTYVPATLTAGSYNVTATANYEGKSVSKDIAVTVSAATPEITVSPKSVDFGSVEQNASVDAKTIAVTLKAIEGNATIELSGAGASAFSVTPASLSESGDITITPSTATVGVFAAVITISAKDAESVEIPVSMTVTEVAPTYTYTLVTDASDLMPGDVIIIGTAITNGFKVASSYNSTDKLLSPTDDGDATEAEGVVTTGYAMEFILGGTEGAWTLTSNDGVLGVYTAKKITFDPSVYNYTNTWTIAIDANNKATIASTNSSYGKILYNVSSPRFLNYTSDPSSTMLLPKIYRKDNKGTVTTVRTDLTIGRYGTICLPRGIEVGQFTGAIFYSITYKDVANSLLIADEVKSLEAGRPYLFLATDTKIKARLNDDAVAEPVNTGNNGLYGVFEKLEITDLNVGDGIYMLMNDVLYKTAVGSWLAPNRAYVKLSEVSETVVGQVAGRRRMVASTPKSTPTDVEEIFNAQSVNGKFLINGQLFILRDGKTYDAQGKLVK